MGGLVRLRSGDLGGVGAGDTPGTGAGGLRVEEVLVGGEGGIRSVRSMAKRGDSAAANTRRSESALVDDRVIVLEETTAPSEQLPSVAGSS